MTYARSAAARAGYEMERALEFARHGAKYLVEKMWDEKHGGFYWMTDRKGRVTIDRKIAYGQSFGIYAMSEYYLATGDETGDEFNLFARNRRRKTAVRCAIMCVKRIDALLAKV
jgi:mannobiose 2-epimerase